MSDCTTNTAGHSCNISFDPHGFTLQNSGCTTFYRGDGQWTIVEGNVPDYRRIAIDCTSADGLSTFTTSLTSEVTQLELAAGDVVTCTYVSDHSPPVGLSISNQTTGGVGSFHSTVTDLKDNSAKAKAKVIPMPVKLGYLRG